MSALTNSLSNVKMQNMKAESLVNFTLLKNITFKGKLSLTLKETKELLDAMNSVLDLKNFLKFEVNFAEVKCFLKENFKEQKGKFLANEEYLKNTSFTLLELNDDQFEVFAYRQNTNNKFKNKTIVQAINRKIVAQVSDKEVLDALTTWRRWSVDTHSEDSDYYYLQEWDMIKQTRANFHNYSIEKDV